MALERKKALKADPEKTKKWIQDSRKPLAQGDKPLKRTEMKKKPSKKKVEYEKELDELTPALYRRSKGLCQARVSPQCRGRGEHRHHRKVGRGKGTNTIENLMHVCNRCHEHIHLHVTESRELGFLVKRTDDPADIPFSAIRKVT